MGDYESKRKKYMPVYPKATGKPTVYIEGYPSEDAEIMPAIGSHGRQINVFYDQLWRYFENNADIHVGFNTFIYYREDDRRKCVLPDVFVALGAAKDLPRQSFYTWSEGTVPTTVFEFLFNSRANQDWDEKVGLYLREIGVQEYFIHQPDSEKPSEFRGWRRTLSGGIVEIEPEVEGGLFSEALNLWFRYKEPDSDDVRLLRPYLPDGTPITTSMEEEQRRIEAEMRVAEEFERRREAETRAEAAEAELERLRAQLARNP